MRNITLALLLLSVASHAQLPAPPPPAAEATPEGAPLFRTSSQLVVVNVTVKDKDGNFMNDLKASDFSGTEDGKPQTLRVFEFQKLEAVPLAPPTLISRDPADAAPAAPQ